MNSVIKHNINKNNVAILRLNCTRELRYFIGNCAAWVVVEKKACFALGQGISSKFDSDNEEWLSYKSFSKCFFDAYMVLFSTVSLLIKGMKFTKIDREFS